MQRILSILLFLTIYITLCAQNLDNLPTEKRDSLLKAKSKEIILRYGPGYYREYKAPTIERIVVPPSETNPEGTNVGRAFYTIIYWYDKTKERLEEDFAAKVKIWADTGEPAADLAAVVAIASSYLDKPVPDHMAAIGEVGLSGEIRSISHLEQRLTEVHRLGFTQCMIPARRARELKPLPGLELLPVQNIAQALRLLVREK